MSQEVYKSIDNKSIVYPLVYYSHHDGAKYVFENHGVHRVTGEVYSKRISNINPKGYWQRLAVSYPTSWSSKSQDIYPKTSIGKVKNADVTKIDRFGVMSTVGQKNIQIHRAVASTLLERPDRNHDFDETEWKYLKPHNKRKQLGLLEANHIDHDTNNFRPNNLEWTNREENIQAYVEHNEQRKAA